MSSKVIEDLSEAERYLLAMLQDQSGIDMSEFSWTDHQNDDNLYRCWDFQVPYYRCQDKLQISQGARSIGKALDVDTPVQTISGWSTMGELRVGDFVYARDGSATVVVAAHDVLYDRRCYELAFTNGETIVADEDHLWPVHPIDPDGTLSHRQFQVLTTAQILAYGTYGARGLNFFIESDAGLVGINTIDPVVSRPVRCIEVKSQDHCFRVGRSNIVTHNSQGVAMRCWALPFSRPGDDMLLTAPEMIHLRPLAQVVEERLLASQLSREMLRKTKTSNGITKNPFEVRFRNGTRILGRIPNRDGRGVKGQHPASLELDEAQDYPEQGWKELGETLKFGQEDAIWRSHGVTTGLRNTFFRFSQPNSGWVVHRLTAVHRPDWSDEERQAKIDMYGGRDTPDYRRNIMGEHGDASSPLFVISRLMSCVDDDESSDYNVNDYEHHTVNNTDLDGAQDFRSVLDVLLSFPGHHRDLKSVWAGMDVGMTTDPSEILVFADNAKEEFRLYLRLTLNRLSAPAQRHVLARIFDYYRPQAIAMDRTGLGLPIYSELVEASDTPRDRQLAERMVGYNFSEKVHVGDEMINGVSEKIMANVIEISSDVLRGMVDRRQLVLPWDLEIIRDFQGQTVSGGQLRLDGYGKKRKSGFHVLDAARMAALAFHTRHIRETDRRNRFEPIMDGWL